MIRLPNGRVRFTRSELNRLRRDAAKNGFVIETVKTVGEYLEASILALDDERVQELLRFMDRLDEESDQES